MTGAPVAKTAGGCVELQGCEKFAAFSRYLRSESSVFIRLSCVSALTAGDLNPQVAGSIPAGRTMLNQFTHVSAADRQSS